MVEDESAAVDMPDETDHDGDSDDGYVMAGGVPHGRHPLLPLPEKLTGPGAGADTVSLSGRELCQARHGMVWQFMPSCMLPK